ncbi:hypothetical protein CYMTET_8915 [Cymbomonas tetramitiformis]|uniref:Uncharacterized protein n=1 Tax=Cymbomonas tetramitiformis TaxID=36881 RepID=A0AAE0GSD0_9CHLO|nr:hypothetical protein CYMTET_39323 [Cymbomonas tetramitiformis]KAK3283387.1 hypothetical protein CYMTET_8915 [Cymbomonas tetramitiformis]
MLSAVQESIARQGCGAARREAALCPLPAGRRGDLSMTVSAVSRCIREAVPVGAEDLGGARSPCGQWGATGWGGPAALLDVSAKACGSALPDAGGCMLDVQALPPDVYDDVMYAGL